MRKSGMTFEDIGLALNVSTNWARERYRQYRADVDRKEGRGLQLVEVSKGVFVIREVK